MLSGFFAGAAARFGIKIPRSRPRRWASMRSPRTLKEQYAQGALIACVLGIARKKK